MIQLAARVDDAVAKPSSRLRSSWGQRLRMPMCMFVMAFNVNQGFPCEVRVKRPVMEPLSNERGALDFIDNTSSELISDAW